MLLRPFSTLLAVALATLASPTFAQGTFPDRPIRFVVPFAAGGGADVIARAVSEPLAKELGQPVIIDNKPGAGATLGADFVAKSAPDGYTILYGTPGPQMVNPYLMKKLPYDPVNDLAAISGLVDVANVLVVNPKVPARTVKELIELARAKPNTINYSSAGIGASSHLSGEYFRLLANVQITHVPYKGSGAALQDLLAGNVQMAIDSVPVMLPHIRSGGLRAVAVTSLERSPLLPDAPTVAADLPGFESSAYNYVSTRGGTPRPVIDRLNAAFNAVLKQPAVRERLLGMGALPVGSTPEQLDAKIKSESAKWKKVIEVSGAKAE